MRKKTIYLGYGKHICSLWKLPRKLKKQLKKDVFFDDGFRRCGYYFHVFSNINATKKYKLYTYYLYRVSKRKGYISTDIIYPKPLWYNDLFVRWIDKESMCLYLESQLKRSMSTPRLPQFDSDKENNPTYKSCVTDLLGSDVTSTLDHLRDAMSYKYPQGLETSYLKYLEKAVAGARIVIPERLRERLIEGWAKNRDVLIPTITTDFPMKFSIGQHWLESARGLSIDYYMTDNDTTSKEK